MTNPAPAETCRVSFLVPHPDRLAVMVAEGARLPTISLATDEPLLSEILAAVDELDSDTTVVLRQVMTSSSAAEDDEVRLLVECDAFEAAAPSGRTWLDLD